MQWRATVLRFAPALLTLAVMVIVATLFVSGAPILDLIELKTYDLRVRFRGPRPPSDAVVMAAIDEKSLDVEGRWPWPRSKIATLIDVLSRDGARVIGFDITFSEPDENSQLALIDEISRQLDTLALRDRRVVQFLGEHRRNADNDVALAASIRGSSAAVILGYFFHMTDATLDYRLEPGEIAQRVKTLGSSKYPRVVYAAGNTRAVPFVKAYAPETNLPAFSEVAAASGYFSLQSDPDGVLRWMPLMIQAGEDEELFPPLSVACVWHYLGKPPLQVMVGRNGVDGIAMGDRFIPTDETGRLLINYAGPAKTFPQIPVTDILRGQAPAGTFKDRIVLVGATALATYDIRNTPFSPLYPGMEVHASVIDNILTRNFMTRPEWSKTFGALAIFVLATCVGAALPRLGPIRGLVFAAALFTLYIFVARSLFVAAGVWLNLVYPLLGLVATYIVLTAYSYLTEQRQRKRVKETFGQYVAPVVVEEMLKDPRRLQLGGEIKTLTVLFSDLEGFTTHSERFTPHQMQVMLGEYYTHMTEQIYAQQGMLKEYVGDELMVIFGAPLEQADHAERACAAALAMRDKRLQLAADWAKIGRPILKARTGLNSGEMLVGNLGSKYRFSYGAMGDNVNLGSRLEGLNKVYGTDILVGENTARLVKHAFLLRELDTVRVLGRGQSLRIYELVARAGMLHSLEQEKALKSFAAGLEAYRQKVWGEALALFEQACAIYPSDGPARAFAERCEIYRKNPPPEDWDGVFEQTFKK